MVTATVKYLVYKKKIDFENHVLTYLASEHKHVYQYYICWHAGVGFSLVVIAMQLCKIKAHSLSFIMWQKRGGM